MRRFLLAGLACMALAGSIEAQSDTSPDHLSMLKTAEKDALDQVPEVYRRHRESFVRANPDHEGLETKLDETQIDADFESANLYEVLDHLRKTGL